MKLKVICILVLIGLVSAALALTQVSSRPSPTDGTVNRVLGDCARCHAAQCRGVDAATKCGWIKPGDPERSPLYVYAKLGNDHKPTATRLSDADLRAVRDYIESMKAPPVNVAVKDGKTDPAAVSTAGAKLPTDAAIQRARLACAKCHMERHQDVDIAGQRDWIVPGEPDASRFYRQIARNHMKGVTRLTEDDAQAVYDYIERLAPAGAASTGSSAPAGTSEGPVALKPGDFPLRINCGSSTDYKDPDGNTWRADRKFAKGGWGYVGGEAYWHPKGNPERIENTNMEALYRSERSNHDAYRVTVPANGRYTARLHFAESFDHIDAPTQRVFSVLVEGKEVLKELDVYEEAGFAVALVKTVEAEVTDGVLNIDFRWKSQWGPMINAIEVIHAASASAPGGKER